MLFKKDNLCTVSLKILIFVSAIVFFVQGCASAPKENPALTSAKAAYEKAKADPMIEANAPVPLYDAGETLKRAERAGSDAETVHLAYLAEKQTAIAVATAEQKIAETDRQELADEKDRILLEQRERQAREARGEARAATDEAARQRMTAEQRAREADEARKLAELKRLEAEKAAQEARELEEELAALKAKKTDRGIVMTLGDILFVTAKADLMPGAQRTIDQLAAFLNKYQTRKLVVEGHTDSRGSEAYNMTLSQHRADSVRSALVARGISPERITTKAMGELYPIASNATPAGRQQNRRVEILILSQDQTSAQKTN